MELFDAFMFITFALTVIMHFAHCLDYLPGTVVLYNKHPHMDSTPPPVSISLLNTSPDQNPVNVAQLHAAITYQNEELSGLQGQLMTL